MLLKNSEIQPGLHPATETTDKERPVTPESILANSLFYRLKRDVLELVAHMNHGVSHNDCEVIKRQTMFVQSQLLHSLYSDPSLASNVKILLMDYHAKSIRATLGDRRGEHLRDKS
ncbi:hypothetical protein [Collimonas antrihumi]|uniref:hypothetical protein n=1 Tax=Collimonas antrihumi TaxID=1940615 RepID=UPI001B8AD283|nr:hypothetical protein [Collimonas antrihumi]